MTESQLAEIAGPVLDALPQHIALIDAGGQIRWVNRAWRLFGERNGGEAADSCGSSNYLQACRRAQEQGDPQAAAALQRILAVIGGQSGSASYEYPCHSPTEQRWFVMRCSALDDAGRAGRMFVVTHEDVTERRLAKQRLEQLATMDSLTGIANRRRLDEFLAQEWRRARRQGQQISLILLDVDNFKGFNDTHGHPAGDECLRRVARVLSGFARRPGDIVARYGGEEFAMVLGDTGPAAAIRIAEGVRLAVSELAIPHPAGDGWARVTISAGVATFRPGAGALASDLKATADTCLYRAKQEGRNRVCSSGAVHLKRAAG